VVAPSVFVAESLARWYGYTDVVRLVPNGVGDLTEGMRPARIYDALIAGRLWDPAKNLKTYVEAVAGLPGRSFAAAGPLAQPGESSPAPPEHLRYLGTLSRAALRAALARSRILVAPSIYDPFGLVPVEAALAGCCLVLGDIPSYRDLWGESAVYVEPRQPEALRQIIASLLDDAPRRTSLAEAARSRARARYTADRMVASYLQIYQRTALRYGLAP
jgi:glycosyltransferase involved in cell wall biosynthesis